MQIFLSNEGSVHVALHYIHAAQLRETIKSKSFSDNQVNALTDTISNFRQFSNQFFLVIYSGSN
jgi:hypothetical protein